MDEHPDVPDRQIGDLAAALRRVVHGDLQQNGGLPAINKHAGIILRIQQAGAAPFRPYPVPFPSARLRVRGPRE